MEAFHKAKLFIGRHKKLLSILTIILIIIGVIVSRSQAAPPVETYKVKTGNITEALSASGKVTSLSAVDLSFTMPGKLVYLGAQEGDRVKKGQTIAMLDQRTIQKNLETTLIDYSKARLDFDQTEDDNQNRRPQDALNDDMKRILEHSQHDLEKAIRSVELQTLAREQSVLISPIDGVLIKADAKSPGVNVSTTTTFSIANPDQLVFETEVDEADVGKVILGQPVNIVLDAYPDDTVNASVESIDYASHTTTTGGNVFTVKSTLPPTPDVQYRIGMNGDAEIIITEQKDVVVVPLGSITDDQAVFVKTENGFKKRKVKTGIQSDINTEIISGLKKGETIALDPAKGEEVGEKKKKFILF